MRRVRWFAMAALAGLLATPPPACAQKSKARPTPRPYIGFVYPAGGRQGTTFRVKLGGQGLDGVRGAIVSGSGVSARLVGYQRKIGPQEMTLLRQQLEELRRGLRKGPWRGQRRRLASVAPSTSSGDEMMMMMSGPDTGAGSGGSAAPAKSGPEGLAERIQRRMRDYVQRPASASLGSIAYLEIDIAADAPSGEREMRLVTLRGGASNPLPFHVGALPEHTRKAMGTSPLQVLGKEQLALRKRPEDEVEARIEIPCTLNGQVASGEINRYRFEARKGQRLVIATLARRLIPFIADAVPGWFQPVVALYDAEGREVAYEDDYRFMPDPTLVYRIPSDGQYVFTITDAIYRGREDFVYRVTIGGLPFITSIFPLGGRVGAPFLPQIKGYNLRGAELEIPPAEDAPAGIHTLAARRGEFLSNRVPFALGTSPEIREREPNDTGEGSQRVTLPVVINGRIDKDDDWDVFEFVGRAGENVVAHVDARRLDSPVDSVLKLTDATGQPIAFNDDHEDAGAGLNTHHADSYLMVKLPAAGPYRVHIGDAGRQGGVEYGYRLRISAPRPDFDLRVTPSSVGVRQGGYGSVTVHALRRDGFTGPIRVALKNPPPGVTSYPAVIEEGKESVRLGFKAGTATAGPVDLVVVGRADIAGEKVSRTAVAAEDRMQAFLWQHLVPARDLKLVVHDPSRDPQPARVPPEPSPEMLARAKARVAEMEAKGQKFNKGQVAGRVRQIRGLYDEGLLTNNFYAEKIAECEVAEQ